MPEALNMELEFAGIDEAATSFTNLGKVLQESTKAFSEIGKYLTDITNKIKPPEDAPEKWKGFANALEAVSAASKGILPQEALNAISSFNRSMGEGSGSTAAYLKSLSDVQGKIKSVNEAHSKGIITDREKERILKSLSKEQKELTKETEAYMKAQGRGAFGKMGAGLLGGMGAGMEAGGGAIGGMVANQARSAVHGIKSVFSGLPIFGGLMGLIVHGQVHKDKMKAEAGEILDITTGMGDAASRKLTGQQAGFLTGFQHTMDKFYGISKESVQGVLKTFGDAGFSVGQVLEGFNKDLGIVGKNFLTVSLALDKHYNIATGTSAKMAISLTQDYGQSLRNSQEMLLGMAEAGEKSHMGVQRFMMDVMNAAAPLRQYGVNVGNVVQIHQALQKQLVSMGLDKAVAGIQASLATGQITQGIANLSMGMQAQLGERMGMGTGLEARYEFREGISRMQAGGDQDFLIKTVRELGAAAEQRGGGSPQLSRMFLESQGIGFEGAKGIMAVYQELKEGKTVNQKSLSGLLDAYKSEAQKTSDLKKMLEQALEGLAKIGGGILRTLIGLAATVIFAVRNWTGIVSGRAETERKMDRLFGEMSGGWGEIKEGFKGVTGAGKLFGKSILGRGGVGAMEIAFGDAREEYQADPAEKRKTEVIDNIAKAIVSNLRKEGKDANISEVYQMARVQYEKGEKRRGKLETQIKHHQDVEMREEENGDVKFHVRRSKRRSGVHPRAGKI